MLATNLQEILRRKSCPCPSCKVNKYVCWFTLPQYDRYTWVWVGGKMWQKVPVDQYMESILYKRNTKLSVATK